MPDISAKDVAALRKVSGAGMMDCKRALEESAGDLDAAKTWLREKGLAAAGKRSGRAASQGTVDVYVEGGVGAVVELTCETDFVAKGDGFKSTVATLAKQVAEQGEDISSKPYAGDPSETVDDMVKGMAGTLGENIGLGRVARFEVSGGLIEGHKQVPSAPAAVRGLGGPGRVR